MCDCIQWLFTGDLWRQGPILERPHSAATLRCNCDRLAIWQHRSMLRGFCASSQVTDVFADWQYGSQWSHLGTDHSFPVAFLFNVFVKRAQWTSLWSSQVAASCVLLYLHNDNGYHRYWQVVVDFSWRVLSRHSYSFDRFMLLKNPLANRIDPQSAIIIIWSLSLVICIPTLFSMRVSEYFTPKRLILCRIVAQTDNKWNRYIRKYRVLFVIFTQYLIPLVIASIFYSKCIRIIMSRRRIG